MESRWVDPETRGAEVGSPGARAARISGGGRGVGGARARAQRQTATPWSPNPSQPPWRCLPGACSGAARPGPGEAPGPRSGRQEGPGHPGRGSRPGPSGPDCAALTPRPFLPQCPGALRCPIQVPEAAPALAWPQGLPPRRLSGPG